MTGDSLFIDEYYASSQSSSSNFSNNVSDYPSLEACGPQMQTFLVGLYSLTALLALSGNLTVIIVLLVGKRSSRELRVFLINLALSDITMAIFCIPFTYTAFMLGKWIFETWFCPCVLFMQHCSVIVSVYTLTAIGVDRYYAIMHPLSARWTKSRGPLVIAIIWILAIGLSSIQLVHGRAVSFTWGDQTYYDCKEVWSDFSSKIYTMSIFTITFALPLIVLTYTYAIVGWKMWKHTSPGNADPSRDEQQMRAKMKVVKMLAMVVILFACCWLPLQTLNILLYFRRDLLYANTDAEYFNFIATFFCVHWLAMANSFVNPIIYCFMSDNFRTDLKQLVLHHWPFSPQKRPSRLTTTRSSSFRTSSLVLSTHKSKMRRLTPTHTANNMIHMEETSPFKQTPLE